MNEENLTPPGDRSTDELKPVEKIKEIHHHHYYGPEVKRGAMNFGQLFFGLLLLFFGIAYLARSLGIVEFNLVVSWVNLWPVLVIIAGLSLISFRSWFGGLIGIILIFILAGIVIFLAFTPVNYQQFGPFQMMGGGTSETTEQENIIIAKEDKAKQAEINVKIGAGEFKIGGTTTDLISGSYSSNFLQLKQDNRLDGETQKVSIETVGSWPLMMARRFNELNLMLNPNLPLKLNFETGAMAMNFDLRESQVPELNIDTGVSSLELHLGDKVDQAKVTIKAGASSIKIWLPSYVGAKLNIDSGLTSKNFKDFEKIDDRHYQSKNYNLVSKKIDFDLEVGVSSVAIDWE